MAHAINQTVSVEFVGTDGQQRRATVTPWASDSVRASNLIDTVFKRDPQRRPDLVGYVSTWAALRREKIEAVESDPVVFVEQHLINFEIIDSATVNPTVPAQSATGSPSASRPAYNPANSTVSPNASE